MERNQIPDTDITTTLGVEGPAHGRKRPLGRILGGIGLAVVVVSAVAWMFSNGDDKYSYTTKESSRGDLVVSVSATGNLEPTNQVDVGSELSGIVRSVEVDYNDHVEKGQVLAWLDTDKLAAKALQSRASLASARSNVLQAQATLREKRNDLDRLKRVFEQSGGKVPSRNELEAAEAALLRAQADEDMARSKVTEAEATLEVSETDLNKAAIRSPINGVVLARSVEPGQTVAASLQAPVLFTLAEDLTKMELHVGVDEADVGEVKEGQEAMFTVDAYPERRFPARVTQVRYGSQTSGGVVTYKAVLVLDNSELLLRPGMTATADIIVKRITSALLVPNAALRFSPPADERDKNEKKSDSSMISKLFPRPPRGAQKSKQEKANPREQTVWVLKDRKPVPVKVTTGATDGSMTEIVRGDIAPGTALVVDALSLEK
ncbi:MAG TPA: efflux RND transporter periplasmic adaptor subunit [Deltaproteobacteria bacterium]|nr:efflux RND transporter periplasmic adaptor subunit [Deltaproteobacteria bacterium]